MKKRVKYSARMSPQVQIIRRDAAVARRPRRPEEAGAYTRIRGIALASIGNATGNRHRAARAIIIGLWHLYRTHDAT